MKNLVNVLDENKCDRKTLLTEGYNIIEEEDQADWQYLIDKLGDCKFHFENLQLALTVLEQLKIEDDIALVKPYLENCDNLQKMAIADVVLYFSNRGVEFYREIIDYDLTDQMNISLNHQEKIKKLKKQP